MIHTQPALAYAQAHPEGALTFAGALLEGDEPEVCPGCGAFLVWQTVGIYNPASGEREAFGYLTCHRPECPHFARVGPTEDDYQRYVEAVRAYRPAVRE